MSDTTSPASRHHAPFLSVVVPSYNERRNLDRGVLDDVVAYLQKQSYTWEVILSDDGSTDGTLEALHAFAKQHEHVQVLENAHGGKGPTVQSGMLAARGTWRLFTDFDQSVQLHTVGQIRREILKPHQLADDLLN
jgi:glycosyltransferase involved in cell wall biosynthesis